MKTTTYLNGIRDNLYKYILAYFIFYFSITAASFGVSYLVFFHCGSAEFLIVSPVVTGNLPSAVLSAVLSVIPCTISLIVLFVSTYTIFYRFIASYLCFRRGIFAGCFTALSITGKLNGISTEWSVGLTFYILSTVIFLVITAITTVYSNGIRTAHSMGEKRISLSLTAEWIKLFLPYSGAVYLTGLISVILI